MGTESNSMHERRRERHMEHGHIFHGAGKVVFAMIFIIVGFTMLGHNMGYISDYIYHIIVSWKMLLIALGIISLIKRQFTPGAILITIGSYFLLPQILGLQGDWIRTYWPLILILSGITILFQKRQKIHIWKSWHSRRHGDAKESVEDGFVTLSVSFGSTKTIVMDPIFKGGNLDVSFGSVVLDLKRTLLEAPETIINIDCSFGGIELYIPATWYVVIQSDNTFGGCEDKRWLSQEIDYEHKLIIRGDLSFSGIEVKS